MLLFGLAQSCELGFVRCLFAAHVVRCFATTVLFVRAQPHYLLFDLGNSTFGNLPPLLFFGTLAGLYFNSLPLVLSAPEGHLLFLLMPALLLGAQRVLGSHARGVNFRAPGRFIGAQFAKFSLQRRDFLGPAVNYRLL
ncbi:MAG TPA: hypothetical protein VE961_20400 [Pyrinomonadaceae bacterium]|nr:hypothetical protein [Pyrinomonadaceae bacterium]